MVSFNAPSRLFVIAVCLLSIGSSPAAENEDWPEAAPRPPMVPRARVAMNDDGDTDVRDCINNVVDAANAEDLEGFLDCFTAGMRSRIRKRLALRFVQHDVGMELLDFQIVTMAATRAEVAVKYRLTLSADRFDVVSLVSLRQHDGTWRIDGERIQSCQQQSSAMYSRSRPACAGPACRLADR